MSSTSNVYVGKEIRNVGSNLPGISQKVLTRDVTECSLSEATGSSRYFYFLTETVHSIEWTHMVIVSIYETNLCNQLGFLYNFSSLKIDVYELQIAVNIPENLGAIICQLLLMYVQTKCHFSPGLVAILKAIDVSSAAV